MSEITDEWVAGTIVMDNNPPAMLKRFAVARGLTQKEISKRTGIRESVISRYFTGDLKITKEPLKKIILAMAWEKT